MKYKEENFPIENDDIYHIQGPAEVIAGEGQEHKDDETQASDTKTNV